jgi:hypothetical protein
MLVSGYVLRDVGDVHWTGRPVARCRRCSSHVWPEAPLCSSLSRGHGAEAETKQSDSQERYTEVMDQHAPSGRLRPFVLRLGGKSATASFLSPETVRGGRGMFDRVSAKG